MSQETWYDNFDERRREYKAKADPRQTKLANLYVKYGDATKAALEAGYSEKTATHMASKLLKHPAVKKIVDRQLQRCEDELGMTKDWKLGKLKAVIDGTIPDDSSIIPEMATVGIKAISEANKMQGHLAPTTAINANLNANAEADSQQLADVMDELLLKHKKEY
jgi:phage terminase small subunit